MTDSPTLRQRQALGNLFEELSEELPNHCKNYFWEDFESWNIIRDSTISGYDYYYELKHLPDYPKRKIVCSALRSWNKHHDLLVLRQIICSLIYLKICGPTEYFFMQYIYNFLEYFSSVCDDNQSIEIEQNMFRQNMFTMRFWKDTKHSDSHGIIQFQMSKMKEEQRIAIVPWFNLIVKKIGVITTDNNSIDRIVKNEFIPLLTNEFVKQLCPWISSDLRFGYGKSQLDTGIVIMLSSMEYVDCYGVMGFLTLTESQVDMINPFPGAKLRKIGRSQLDRSLTGVSYVLSMQQSFFLIFDSDFSGTAVVQKTYWGDETDSIYNMIKAGAIQGKRYPGSDGFFIYTPQAGHLLVEKQVLEGEKCISVSRECIL